MEKYHNIPWAGLKLEKIIDYHEFMEFLKVKSPQILERIEERVAYTNIDEQETIKKNLIHCINTPNIQEFMQSKLIFWTELVRALLERKDEFINKDENDELKYEINLDNPPGDEQETEEKLNGVKLDIEGKLIKVLYSKKNTLLHIQKFYRSLWIKLSIKKAFEEFLEGLEEYYSFIKETEAEMSYLCSMYYGSKENALTQMVIDLFDKKIPQHNRDAYHRDQDNNTIEPYLHGVLMKYLNYILLNKDTKKSRNNKEAQKYYSILNYNFYWLVYLNHYKES